jgi:hypothetical protein
VRNSQKTGVAQWRRLALELPSTIEGEHMQHADFRLVKGKTTRIFATLARDQQGFGVLMLTPEQQQAFCSELQEVFQPFPAGWGRNGATLVKLDAADEETMRGGLRAAYSNILSKLEKKPAKAKSTP